MTVAVILIIVLMLIILCLFNDLDKVERENNHLKRVRIKCQTPLDKQLKNDLAQLRDNHIRLIIQHYGGIRNKVYTPEEFDLTFGFNRMGEVDFRGFAGDNGKNIPLEENNERLKK